VVNKKRFSFISNEAFFSVMKCSLNTPFFIMSQINLETVFNIVAIK